MVAISGFLLTSTIEVRMATIGLRILVLLEILVTSIFIVRFLILSTDILRASVSRFVES